MTTVADLDIDFDSLLVDARVNASTDWEDEFVADILTRYSEYADTMFISTKQIEILERIAQW